MNVRMVLGVAAGSLLSVAAVAAAPVADVCTATYKAKVQPIFNTNCVACHQDAAPAGELSLQRSSAPASLLGVQSSESKLKRVAPGDPQNSYLYRKMMGTHLAVGAGEKMPLGGGLSSGDIAVISAWISSCKGK